MSPTILMASEPRIPTLVAIRRGLQEEKDYGLPPEVGQVIKKAGWTRQDPKKNWLVVNPHFYLIGGLEHVLFFHILGIITPTG